MIKNKKVIILGLVLSIFLSLPVFASSQGVVVLGEDLSKDQEESLLKMFSIRDRDKVKVLSVSNQEERKYLGEYIDSSKIGTRAISSVYIDPQGSKDLEVSLININWVTEDMYKNALATAGINKGKIVIASPFEVSGTSALTGIFKAFEDITGEEISEDNKDLANQELALMGELKEIIGDKETVELFIKAKKEVLLKNYKSFEDIEEEVKKIAKDLGIDLKEEDIKRLTDFLSKLTEKKIDTDKILESLKSIEVDKGQVKGFLLKFKELMNKLLDFILGLFEG